MIQEIYKGFEIVVNDYRIGLILTGEGTVIQKVNNVSSAEEYISDAKSYVDGFGKQRHLRLLMKVVLPQNRPKGVDATNV